MFRKRWLLSGILPLAGLLYGCPGNGETASPSLTTPVVKQETTADASGTEPKKEPAPPKSPTQYAWQIVEKYPHDRAAYTQGLLVQDGEFLESTGLNGQSSLRRVAIKTGKVRRKIAISAQFFAEGLTLFKDKLYQITWQSGTAFTYDPKTFARTGEFPYSGEGWGLTNDAESLLMSDGSDEIKFIDPATFTVRHKISVTDKGIPVTRLNELEYREGEIWANVYQTDEVVRIDPKTGEVTGKVDFTGLLPASARRPDTDVLNGIARDPKSDKLYITGKRWPYVYLIKLTPKKPV